MNITTENTFEIALVQSLVEHGGYTQMRLTVRKAAKAIGKFVSLHPHNLAQKTEIAKERNL